MKAGKVTGLTKTALVATGLLFASFAFADPPSASSPGMRIALAKAKEGSTELRRYVERTKPIWGLDYFEVKSVAEAQQTASNDDGIVVAQNRQ